MAHMKSGYPDIRSSEYWKSGNPDFRISGIPEYRISGYTDIPDIQNFQIYRISRISGYTVIRIPDIPDIRKCRCTDIRNNSNNCFTCIILNPTSWPHPRGRRSMKHQGVAMIRYRPKSLTPKCRSDGPKI